MERRFIGIDVVRPGMLHAAVAFGPVAGGRIASVATDAAAVREGVHSVVTVGDNAVAVLADDSWQAHSAARALKISADSGAPRADSSHLFDDYRESLATATPTELVEDETGSVPEPNDGALNQTYELPYLAHLCLEPMNATALFQDES